MANLLTTRRAVLGAISAAPLAGLAASEPALSAISTLSAARLEWGRLLSQYQEAKAAYEADAASGALDRALDAYDEMRPSPDSIHWREFTFQDRTHVASTMDVEERWRQFLAGEGRIWWARDPGARKAEYRAALDSVLAYRSADEEAKERTGVYEAEARSERLESRVEELLEALILMPAPDKSALCWKMEQLWGNEGRLPDDLAPEWTWDWLDAVMADARRLLTAEG